MTDINPYEPTTTIDREQPSTVGSDVPGKTRWRLIPVVLCYVFGALACAAGVWMFFVWITRIFEPYDYPDIKLRFTLAGMVAMAIVFSFGTAYLVAGRMFWKRRYVFAIVLCIAGVSCAAIGGFIFDWLMNVRWSGD